MAYTEKELIEEIKRVSERNCNSEPPKTTDMRKHGEISIKTFTNRFGSWKNAIKEAGFQEYESRGFYKGYSDEYLISELQSVFRKAEGTKLTARHFNKCSDVSDSTLRGRFGSWNEALEEAGLPINKEHEKHPLNQKEIDALRDEIDEYIEKCKNPFDCKMSDFVNQSDIINSLSPINTHFGSWNELYEDITEETIEESRVKYRMEEINRVIDNKETLKAREVEEELGKSISYVIKYYDSWSNALEELGYEANKPVSNPDSDWYGLSGKNHPVWKGGEDLYEGAYYGPSWTTDLKIKIRKRDGWKCRVCGMDNETHKDNFVGSLNVHHIKPALDFDDPHEQDHLINSEDKLITLCWECHNKVERKWTETSHEEFERRAKEFIGVDKTVNKENVKDSIFAY